MKKIFLLITAGLTGLLSFSQNIDKIINSAEVERIEKILSDDDMQGRKTFTPGIDKAADFIAAEFAKSKLAFWGSSQSYFQEIDMIKAKNMELNGTLDAETLSSANVVVNTTSADLHIHGLPGYETVIVKKEDDFSKMISTLSQSQKNLLVLVDIAHFNLFRRI